MDKDKIISEILNEWAVRSPDGLVSGHDSEKNISVLQKLLFEYLQGNQVTEVMYNMFGEAAESAEDSDGSSEKSKRQQKAEETPDFVELFKKLNPKTNKYDILVTADDKPFKGKSMQPPQYYMKWTKDNIKRAFELSEKDPFWKRLKPEKNIDLDRKEGMKRAFTEIEQKNKSLVKRFKALYNSIPPTDAGVKQAIAIYQGDIYGTVDYSEYLPLVNRIDELRPVGTGRGELVFLFLLNGMKSGGTRSVDLVYAEKETQVKRDQGIEVKEVTAQSLIAISAPTFEGFYRSNFNVAVHELALAASKYENIEDFLKRTMEKMGTNKESSDAVLKFFEEPKVGEISQNFLDGIFSIYAALKTNSTPDENKPSNATVDIDIGGIEKEFNVLNPQTVLPQIQNVDRTQGIATLDMQVAYTKEKGDEYLQHALMKLKFFKKEWTIDVIHDEMMKLLLNNYSKMLVVDKRSGSNAAELYEEPQMKKLRFYSLGFGKVNFKAPPSLK